MPGPHRPPRDALSSVRLATSADAETLARFRATLEEEWTGGPLAPAFGEAIGAWYPRHVGEPGFLAWLVEVDGAAVGCGALVVITRPPYHGNPSGVEGLVTSMYVRPDHRGRGLGRRLLEAILEHGTATRVGRFFLYSTPGARNLYARAGFEELSRGTHMELWPQGR